MLKPCPEKAAQNLKKTPSGCPTSGRFLTDLPAASKEYGKNPPSELRRSQHKPQGCTSSGLQFSSTATPTQPLPGESQTHLLSLICTKTCTESLFPPRNTDPLVPPTPELTPVGNNPGSCPEPSSVPKTCWMTILCQEDSVSLASLGQCISLFYFIVINLKLIHPSFRMIENREVDFF